MISLPYVPRSGMVRMYHHVQFMQVLVIRSSDFLPARQALNDRLRPHLVTLGRKHSGLCPLGSHSYSTTFREKRGKTEMHPRYSGEKLGCSIAGRRGSPSSLTHHTLIHENQESSRQRKLSLSGVCQASYHMGVRASPPASLCCLSSKGKWSLVHLLFPN